MNDLVKMPPFFVANKGERSAKVGLILSTAPERCVVRFTGGCGHMSAADASGLYELFVEAFVQADFKGAILYGGTRMLRRDNPKIVVPGITEIPPLIANRSKQVVSMGIVPRTSDLSFNEFGLIVSSEPGNDFFTIVHPLQKEFLIVQSSVDVPANWDTEWQECVTIIESLRTYSKWQSVLICYNGGEVTERELLATAELGWPVMLVSGSGRTTDKYAQDEYFLAQHPSVLVVDKEVTAIRDGLIKLSGSIPRWMELRGTSDQNEKEKYVQ